MDGKKQQQEVERLRQLVAELEQQCMHEQSSFQETLQNKTEELAKANQMLQLVLDTIPVRVFWKDRDCRYLGCNRLFAQDAGRKHPQELLGCDDYQMDWKDEADLYRADDRDVMESGTAKVNYEEPQTRSDIGTIWLRTSKIPLRDQQGAVIGVLGTYEDITDRKLSEEKLSASLQEKEVLLKELYHRTKNNMQVIHSMLMLQSMQTDDSKLLSIFTDLQNKIHAMSMVHQKLYESNNLLQVDLKEYLYDLATYLFQSHNVSMDRIHLEAELEDLRVLMDIAMPCGLILSELFSNTFKHAFSEESKGKIRLSLKKEEDLIKLQVADNGTGVPPDFDFRNAEGLGLMTIVSIVEYQLSGTISLQTDQGMCWDIQFKDNLYTPRIYSHQTVFSEPKEYLSTR